MLKITDETMISMTNYMLTNKLTLREMEKHYGISRSTLSRWFKIKLPDISMDLYLKVQEHFKNNVKLMPFKGGNATKKYWGK
jgi:predicted XRE-type DNA-binding protein